MKKRSIVVLGCCLGLSLILSVLHAEEHRSAILWTADLKPFSFAALSPDGGLELHGKFSGFGVSYAEHNELIFYFVTEEAAPQLASRNQSGKSSALLLHLATFSKDGSVAQKGSIPIDSRLLWVTTNPEGQLIVMTESSLGVYGHDYAPLSQPRPNRGDYSHWTLRQSSTLKTLLLNRYDFERSISSEEVLNSSSLASLVSWQNKPLSPLVFSSSDTSMVRADSGQQLLIRPFEGAWHIVPTENPLACTQNPVFVTEELLVNACGQEVSLLTTAGTLLLQDPVDRREHLEEPISVTPDGRFVAVSSMQSSDGSAGDFNFHPRSKTRILVYDTAAHRRITAVSVNPVPKNDYDFALAPDGSSVAVMDDDKIRVYAVSPQQ